MKLTTWLAVLWITLVSGGLAAAPKLPARAVTLEERLSGPPDNASTTFATAELRKGKRSRVLRIDFQIEFLDVLAGSVSGSGGLRVNGVGVLVTYGEEGASCSSTFACRIGGSAWLDLDRAEEISPGTFIGQPLAIEARGTIDYNTIGEVTTSIFAQLVKK